MVFKIKFYTIGWKTLVFIFNDYIKDLLTDDVIDVPKRVNDHNFLQAIILWLFIRLRLLAAYDLKIILISKYAKIFIDGGTLYFI